MYAKVCYILGNAIKAAAIFLQVVLYFTEVDLDLSKMPEKQMLPPFYGCGNRPWQLSNLAHVSLSQ